MIYRYCDYESQRVLSCTNKCLNRIDKDKQRQRKIRIPNRLLFYGGRVEEELLITINETFQLTKTTLAECYLSLFPHRDQALAYLKRVRPLSLRWKDIEVVRSQANVTIWYALEACVKADGDIVNAILSLYF